MGRGTTGLEGSERREGGGGGVRVGGEDDGGLSQRTIEAVPAEESRRLTTEARQGWITTLRPRLRRRLQREPACGEH